LCLRYHPDIAREEGAAETFRELQEAYKVLATDGTEDGFAELPDDPGWSTHDWRWEMRYRRGADGDSPDASSSRAPFDLGDVARKTSGSERKAKLEQQLKQMAGSPTRRRRRAVKPLSDRPTFPAAAARFAEASRAPPEDADCPGDGCSTDEARDASPRRRRDENDDADDAGSSAGRAFEARKTRGYQSDRHSTETAHERLNGQLAGLHRKKAIRARAAGDAGERADVAPGGGNRGNAARRRGEEHEVRDETNAARFYGGVGLQLEESTPERFLRLAKLAREWRGQRKLSDSRSLSDAMYSADIIKPSAKELLQAAVEGAALGACA